MFARTSRIPGRRAANLGLTVVVFLLNWSLSSAAAILALAVSLQPTDLATRIGLPMAVQIVAGIVTLDFSAGYVTHRGLHLFPILWRFHSDDLRPGVPNLYVERPRGTGRVRPGRRRSDSDRVLSRTRLHAVSAAGPTLPDTKVRNGSSGYR